MPELIDPRTVIAHLDPAKWTLELLRYTPYEKEYSFPEALVLMEHPDLPVKLRMNLSKFYYDGENQNSKAEATLSVQNILSKFNKNGLSFCEKWERIARTNHSGWDGQKDTALEVALEHVALSFSPKMKDLESLLILATETIATNHLLEINRMVHGSVFRAPCKDRLVFRVRAPELRNNYGRITEWQKTRKVGIETTTMVGKFFHSCFFSEANEIFTENVGILNASAHETLYYYEDLMQRAENAAILVERLGTWALPIYNIIKKEVLKIKTKPIQC